MDTAGGFRARSWPRFLQGPDPRLVTELYEPALAEAVRYDRCCAYFSSTVLAEAARGFGPFLRRIVDEPEAFPRPAVRLFVNEELAAADIEALLARQDTSVVERRLLERLEPPEELLVRHRLEVLAWMVREGWLEVKVGAMRETGGVLHGKFGIVRDAAGDTVVFRGSGNETAAGLRSNYEQFEISSSWEDPGALEYYGGEFELLWAGTHPHVVTVPLPEAVREHLVRLAPEAPPLEEQDDPVERWRAGMLLRFLTEAPYLPGGERAVDEAAPVEPWPHQWSVIQEVSEAWPAGRLLCDEVGMGKTIEALMAIRRLAAGRGVRRLLVLVPAGLLRQWQDEFREKGGMVVPFFDRGALHWPGHRYEPCELEEALGQQALLLSRELARSEENTLFLMAAKPWDLVVLDEAHAARRKKQEEGEFNSATLLLSLLRKLQLAGQARGFLLLSATPMQTHPWEPWDLLSVLGEGGWWLAGFERVRGFYDAVAALRAGRPLETGEAVPAAVMLANDRAFPQPPFAFRRDGGFQAAMQGLHSLPPSSRQVAGRWLREGSPLARRMHRNTRTTLRRYHEEGLLDTPPPKRAVEDRRFNFNSDLERQAYEAVRTYVTRRFELLEEEKPGKGFVMTVYQRRATSSWDALEISLNKRLDGLNCVIKEFARSEWLLDEEALPDLFFDDELPEELSGQKISTSLPETEAEARAERDEVVRLLPLIETARKIDTKLVVFFEELRNLVNEGRNVLVFTEYMDTLHHLRNQLVEHHGENLGCYSGAGGEIFEDGEWRKVSKSEITGRLTEGRLRILLCTDAASEGLNLQAASGLINYDLPWNPSRVEQRIGRVDRIGQEWGTVRIVNLFLTDSVDDRVYSVLEDRCGLFRHFVGPMQPVLQEARRMLMGHTGVDTTRLERRVAEVEDDPLIDAAYDEEPARSPVLPPAPATLGDLFVALEMVPSGARRGISADADRGLVTLAGGAGRPRRLSARKELLEEQADVEPLGFDDPALRELTHRLLHDGAELPLLVVTAERGGRRQSLARWVERGTARSVESAAQLQEFLQTWDGTPADPATLARARQMAEKEAAGMLEEALADDEQCWREGMEAQVEAAKLRLLEELARYLVCWADTTAIDLNQLFYQAMSRNDASAERLKACFARLGDAYPTWPPAIITTLPGFLETQTANQKKARLLGKPLDAALNDPRWVPMIEWGKRDW